MSSELCKTFPTKSFWNICTLLNLITNKLSKDYSKYSNSTPIKSLPNWLDKQSIGSNLASSTLMASISKCIPSLSSEQINWLPPSPSARESRLKLNFRFQEISTVFIFCYSSFPTSKWLPTTTKNMSPSWISTIWTLAPSLFYSSFKFSPKWTFTTAVTVIALSFTTARELKICGIWAKS